MYLLRSRTRDGKTSRRTRAAAAAAVPIVLARYRHTATCRRVFFLCVFWILDNARATLDLLHHRVYSRAAYLRRLILFDLWLMLSLENVTAALGFNGR